MEPTKAPLRAILPLYKVRVVECTDGGFKLALGGSTTMTVTLPHMHLYDVKEGDLLTIYTEVLLAKPQG